MPQNDHFDTCLLVVSCDRYADLWRPFFERLFRFAGDCPFDVALVSNYKVYDDPRVRMIQIGDDAAWSNNVLKALEQIPHPYVLLTVEDLLLTRPVDEKAVGDAIRRVRSGQCGCLHLKSTAPLPWLRSKISMIPTGSVYRVSTVFSLWRKSFLAGCLKRGESAWEFEINGSIRADSFDGFCMVNRTLFHSTNSVIKGKVRRFVNGVSGAGAEGGRSRMTLFEEAAFLTKSLGSYLFKFVPLKRQRALRAMLKRYWGG